jgi:predicted nucleic acid-binding protein
LALSEAVDWVLLDDELARDYARSLGLKVKGTLGTIVSAYHLDLLSFHEVEIVFQSILDRDDIWISEELVKSVRAKLKA